jgi:TolB-like protein
MLGLGGATGIVVMLGAGGLFSVSRWRARVDQPIHSVAVLPAADFSGDTARQALAEEMTALLIDRMSHVAGLRAVTPRWLVVAYKGTRKSSREIGRELGVDGLLQVSVFRDEARARVTASLISASAEQVVWSGSFERAMSELPTLEREVAEAVAREVQRRAR